MHTTIYSARKIITMNASRPNATHVAVRDGRILGAGSIEELKAWGPHELDDRFAAKVLMPGLVEAHAHLMAGGLWRYTYCGYFDLRDPDGRNWPGGRTLEAVIGQLSGASARQPDGPLLGWGFDPIYFGTQRVSRHDLDRVSAARAVGVLHASGHILNVNSFVLEKAGLLRAGVEHPGMPLGADGLPTGELKGPDAMTAAFAIVGLDRSFLSGDEFGVRAFAKLAVRAGVTTSTDLAATLLEPELASLLSITAEDDYPLRLVPLLRLIGMTPAQAVERSVALSSRSTEQLRLGRIKVVADGSIQGFSARMRWPGYFNGAPNGLWYTAPETIRDCYTLALQNGVQVHTHTNGDEATELALDCLAAALKAVPTRDHRFNLQHCQLADAAQFRRMKALDMCVNLFANHHFYWGDQHYSTTVGPERAERMNACATAQRSGVPFTIHSDAPVTPLGPLFTAWCAVNRLTASGRVLGAHERISVADALQAITLGAAYTLKLDHEIGSIESGKRADFCVLDDDPTAVPPEQLKDVRIWGTVQGGRVFQAPLPV
ncbi:MAG: amidohydrolase [Betaproteobacteria bacterium]|nr:amidohydrolase [Betaproteobacteria bacterium]